MSNNSFKDKLITVWDFVKKYAKKTWEYVKVAKMELIIMIALFAIDLISKHLIDAYMDPYDSIELIPNFLNFTYLRNYDAAFGSDWLRTHLGIGARILFCIFAVVASVVFVIILVKNRGGHKLVRIGLGMLVAGAMGNCIDRMALGYVRDFIEFVYFGGSIFGRESFWIFNIADAALVIGVILVVIYYLFIYKGKDGPTKKVDEVAVGGTHSAPAQADEKSAVDGGENAQANADVNKDTNSVGEENTDVEENDVSGESNASSEDSASDVPIENADDEHNEKPATGERGEK